MGVLFAWPTQAKLGRTVTKKKLFEQSRPTAAIRELFTRQVDRMVWEYKLAESTVNLAKSQDVPELHVFSLHLKSRELNFDLPRFLDRAIPFPLIFELRYSNEIQVLAAPKRPGSTAEHKWLIGEYFAGPWLAAEAERVPMPPALDLESLYAGLMASLLPAPAREGECLAETAERLGQAAALEKKIARLAARLKNELQFNRKVELNSQINMLKAEIGELTRR